ncbi:helix-turn-helix domain-containing protein [Tomitella biformata]|uniref:helix-turn-helix domain-containing protein n=1 Tax=Tomitella biformata TaxID=630403 RepID=UPI0004678930|nr:helix-turn-helix domain-containing protein [Tomitella biformata]
MSEESTVPGRQSPPAARVISVLDHLVRNPRERLGLSELARSVGLSKPTCLGILNELTAAGYLTRDDEAKYGLGPALIVAGRAAHNGYALGALARRHLEKLSDEFGAVCSASAVAGDKIVLLESVGHVGNAGLGRVYPFAPPVGLMYVLWEPADVFERWLEVEPALPVRLDRDHLRRVVAQCRADGYLVESLTPVGQQLYRLMEGVAVDELPAEVRELVGAMVSSLGERVYLASGDEGSHSVSVIAAPTFDSAGRQSMVLTLYVGAEISAAEIRRRAVALVAAAQAVTVAAGGLRV